MSALTATSRRRAWTALVVGLVAILAIPAAIEVANRSKRVELLDAAYVIPLSFLLAVISLGMANRARKNLKWLQLREGGTGVATVAVLVGSFALCLALVAALSVGFYGLVLIYQHSR